MNATERISFCLRYLIGPSITLKPSEETLINSFYVQFERNGMLSERQVEILEEIFARY